MCSRRCRRCRRPLLHPAVTQDNICTEPMEPCAKFDRLITARSFAIAHVIVAGIATFALLANHHCHSKIVAIVAETFASTSTRPVCPVNVYQQLVVRDGVRVGVVAQRVVGCACHAATWGILVLLDFPSTRRGRGAVWHATCGPGGLPLPRSCSVLCVVAWWCSATAVLTRRCVRCRVSSHLRCHRLRRLH